jgi:hypothetical protein
LSRRELERAETLVFIFPDFSTYQYYTSILVYEARYLKDEIQGFCP